MHSCHLTRENYCHAHLGVWGSRGGGGRGGAKMAVRVLHLRKLAQLHKVHNVQGVKTPQGDCHHPPTEYLLQHPGLQKQIWATNYIIGIPQATHDIYRLSSPPLHSSPPPQLPDTGAKPLFLPLRPFSTALSCIRMKPIYGCEVSNNFII